MGRCRADAPPDKVRVLTIVVNPLLDESLVRIAAIAGIDDPLTPTVAFAAGEDDPVELSCVARGEADGKLRFGG